MTGEPVEAALDTTIGTPVDFDARATASSASGCTMESTPTGASRNGAAERSPRTSTERSRSAVPTSIFGRRQRRLNASRFVRIVSSAPAPPAT